MEPRRSNRHITAFGRTQTLVAWAEEGGLTSQLIQKRLDLYGWEPERAVSAPRGARGPSKRAA